MKEATELDWLRWFCSNADFGPADGDVQQAYRQQFEEETNTRVPEGWRTDEE